jgi:hypothetical protein
MRKSKGGFLCVVCDRLFIAVFKQEKNQKKWVYFKDYLKMEFNRAIKGGSKLDAHGGSILNAY